ncbi:MAG: hypothetical protein ACLT3H_07450 [Roseburia sp.]
MERRRSVAIYVEGISLVLPVLPVSRVGKFTAQNERQERKRQNPPSFASVLGSILQREDADTSHNFDARA